MSSSITCIPMSSARVLDSPEGLKLGGEQRHLTILFADIVNYTKRSEKTDPAALVALLNDLHDHDDRRDSQERRGGGQD